MTGAYAYTPDIWPPLLGTIFLAVVGLYSWRLSDVPAARLLALDSLFGALWLLGLTFVAAAVAPETKIAWHKFQAIWQLPFATVMTCFTLEYTYPGRWLTRRNLILLSLPSLIAPFLIVFNGSQFTWRRLEITPDGWVMPSYTTLALILMAYGLALVLINVAALLWLFIRSPQHRWPAALMLFGQVAGRVIYLLTIAMPLTPAWPTAIIASVVLPYTMYAIALFGFRIFDPLPAARTVAIGQMQEGMVVLDVRGRVASLNPAAASMLSISAAHTRGKTLPELLSAFPDLCARLTSAATAVAAAGPQERTSNVIEFSLGAEPEARHYALDVSLLKDFRGLTIGSLLLLLDVTEQRRAQAQALEQQRTLAVIRERERLARELHDSLGQVLAFVNAQGQTVRRLLARGEIAAADEHVGRLVEVAREADTDIRESILGLRVALTEQGLARALATYMDQYEQRYGIHTELRQPETLGDGTFEPLVEVQLLRIIQEALTNARKHARAGSVCVTFATEDGRAEIAVQDDGCGFDAEALSTCTGRFGLRVMRERAEEIGGTLIVRSAPGEGTQVIVTAPLARERCNQTNKEGYNDARAVG